MARSFHPEHCVRLRFHDGPDALARAESYGQWFVHASRTGRRRLPGHSVTHGHTGLAFCQGARLPDARRIAILLNGEIEEFRCVRSGAGRRALPRLRAIWKKLFQPSEPGRCGKCAARK